MLKAYAVALALTTTAPVADKQEGVKKAPQTLKEAPVETQARKPSRLGRGGTF
ncbi:hypothetical protein [Alteromonas sp. ASW11-130]|uniref:hypothetical protein n=1 Tax=Alteromonas sp. ASW11-130 TaxID=3015775 RepID=UPI002242106E|nr:hypothetical protein [Alteromonas sp. ASW11-130]MCW8093043.1 hypothetical protein [Alteromonas sp. ASW11-130]